MYFHKSPETIGRKGSQLQATVQGRTREGLTCTHFYASSQITINFTVPRLVRVQPCTFSINSLLRVEN